MMSTDRCNSVARLVTLAAVVALVGCSRNEAERIQDAQRYFGQREVQAGIIELKTVLQTNPESSEARFLLGKGLVLSGDLAGAEFELKRALQARWDDNQVAPLLATVMVGLAKYRAVLGEFGAIRLTDKTAAAELATALCRAHLGMGEVEQAIDVLKAVLTESPDYQPAQDALARIHLARGDQGQARALAERMVARKPDSADAWVLTGDVLMAQGPAGATGASDAYRKALKLQPEQSQAHAGLVALALGKPDEAAARQQIKEMKTLLPRSPYTRFFGALMALRDGNLPQARDQVYSLLREAPENPRVLALAGQIEQQAGAPAQAENLFAKSLVAEPSAPVPRRMLAGLYLQTGRPGKSLETIEPLVRAGSRDIDALLLLGRAHLVLGNTAASEAAFGAAAKLKSGDPAIATGAALVQVAKGQTDAGLAALESISQADPALNADLPLISQLMGRKDWTRALQAIDRYAVKVPKSQFPEMLRAQVFSGKGDRASARKSLEAALLKDAAYLPALQGLANLDWADGKPEAARGRFKTVLENDPNHVDAKVALADWIGRTGGSSDEVAQLMQEAIRARPSDAGIRINLIDFALASGNAGLALSAAQDAAAAIDTPQVQERLGLAHMSTGDLAQATKAFEKMAALQPRSASPQLRLVDVDLARRDFASARLHAQRALELDPQLLLAKRTVALVAIRSERFADAAPVVKALKQQPGPGAAVGWQLDGEVAMAQRQFEPAASAFRKALSLAPSSEVARLLHIALVSARKNAEAQQHVESWLKAHPDDVPFLLSLGEAALAQKDPAQAEKWFRQILARQPNGIEALNNVAYVMALQKKDGAIGLAKRANALAPNRPAIMDTLALTLAAAGKMQESLDLQVQVVTLAPEVPEYRFTLAQMLVKLGHKDAARENLTKLSKYGKEYARHAEVEALLKDL